MKKLVFAFLILSFNLSIKAQYSEELSIENNKIVEDTLDNEDLNYLQISTNFGDLFVMPDYISMIKDLDFKLDLKSDENEGFLITNTGEIMTIKFVSQMFKENGRFLIHIRTKDIEDSDLLKNLSENENFTISNLFIATQELESKFKELAKKRKFSLQDLEKMELSPIATANGAITINGVPEVLDCRRASDLQLDTKEKFTNLLIEVVDAWSR